MATDVDCPSCSQKLRVPDDLLGKKVKCPACKGMFLATASGLEEPVRPVDEEERPSRSSALTPSRRGTPPNEGSDDEDDDDDLPRRSSGRKSRRRRRSRYENYQPHRGVIILIMGILALVTGMTLILGPIAWIMGNNDMKEIQAGRMDPEGEGMTNIGRILGMVATILGIIGLVIGCVFFVIWLIFVVSIFGAAAGASGH